MNKFIEAISIIKHLAGKSGANAPEAISIRFNDRHDKHAFLGELKRMFSKEIIYDLPPQKIENDFQIYGIKVHLDAPNN